MKTFKKRFNHALLMAIRNFKSYLLLSVTIIFSFSFIFIYFFYTDSSLYNEYKEVYQIPENLILMNKESGMGFDNNILKEQLDGQPDSNYYLYYSKTLQDSSNLQIDDSVIYIDLKFIPENSSFIYEYFIDTIIRRDFSASSPKVLKNNEVIIDENLYQLLKNNDDSSIDVPSSNGILKFKPVGTIPAINVPQIKKEEDIREYQFEIFLPIDQLSNFTDEITRSNYMIFSPHHENYKDLASKLEFGFISSFDFIKEANEDMWKSIYLKGFITIILFILLGINLYSTFANSLNERKFEIGVKRALGASEKNIVEQYLIEGLLIMIIGIIVSILLTLNVLLIIKLIYKMFYNVEWTIYISKFSLITGILFCVVNSILHSLLFSMQSINVQVISQLKSE